MGAWAFQVPACYRLPAVFYGVTGFISASDGFSGFFTGQLLFPTVFMGIASLLLNTKLLIAIVYYKQTDITTKKNTVFVSLPIQYFPPFHEGCFCVNLFLVWMGKDDDRACPIPV